MFYSYRQNKEKKYPVCKECLKMSINDFNPDTFLWLIKELDYPWIPSIWKHMLKYSYNPSKKYSLLGKYLACMRLASYKNCTWESSKIFNNFNIKKELTDGKENMLEVRKDYGRS